MLTDRIIGRVGADILAKRISNPGQHGDSVALFRLDKLSSSQIAAVARSILANPDLAARVDLMIPEALVDGQGLPPEVLISHNAGYVRNNATTAKQAKASLCALRPCTAAKASDSRNRRANLASSKTAASM